MAEHEVHLEDPAEIEEERWDDLEELATERRGEEDHVAHGAGEAVQRIAEALGDFVDYKLDVASLDEICSAQSESQYVDFSDPADDDGYSALREGTQALITNLSPSERSLSRARFLADFFGFHAAAGSDRARVCDTTLSALMASVNRRGDSPVPLNAKDGILDLTQRWRRQDPLSLWAGLADRYRDGFMAQSEIVDAVITTSLIAEMPPGDNEPFLWDSKAQYADLVIDLIDRQLPGFPVDAARMYDAARYLQRERNLPTAAVAQALREAFSALAAEPRTREADAATLVSENIAMLGSSIDVLYRYMTDRATGDFMPVAADVAGRRDPVAETIKQRYFESRYDLSKAWETTIRETDAELQPVLRVLSSRHGLAGALSEWSAARRSGSAEAALEAGRKLSKCLSDIRIELDSRRKELEPDTKPGTPYEICLMQLNLLAAEIRREMKEWQGSFATGQDIGDPLGESRFRLERALRFSVLEPDSSSSTLSGRARRFDGLLSKAEPLGQKQRLEAPVKDFLEAVKGKSIGDHGGKTGVTRASETLLGAIREIRGDAAGGRTDLVLKLDDVLDDLSREAARHLELASMSLKASDSTRRREYQRLASEFRSFVGAEYSPVDDPASYWSRTRDDILRTVGSNRKPVFDRGLNSALTAWMSEAGKDNPDPDRLAKRTADILEILAAYKRQVAANLGNDPIASARFEIAFQTILVTLRAHLPSA
jgi:hypothetical protein